MIAPTVIAYGVLDDTGKLWRCISGPNAKPRAELAMARIIRVNTWGAGGLGRVPLSSACQTMTQHLFELIALALLLAACAYTDYALVTVGTGRTTADD